MPTTLHSLDTDESTLRWFVEELWLPYYRELERTVDHLTLADDADTVAEQVTFYRDRLSTDEYRGWVAVADHDGDPPSETDGEPCGLILTTVDEAPPVFDRPDRLTICELYVVPSHRGTGLADDLVARARQRARDAGCGELRLEVDTDNERARAFYDRHGFEPLRHTLVTTVESGDDE